MHKMTDCRNQCGESTFDDHRKGTDEAMGNIGYLPYVEMFALITTTCTRTVTYQIYEIVRGLLKYSKSSAESLCYPIIYTISRRVRET